MSSIQPCGKRSRRSPIPSVIAIPSYMISNEIQRTPDVQIPAEELKPENFNSAKSLYALIERLEEE